MDTNSSASELFAIFTRFFMSEIFLFLMVSLSASYIPFSSERVNSTVQLAASNKF